MELTRAQKARLGVFVATGTGLLVGGILLLVGLSVWEQRDHYTVRFEESVSGLQPSAQVRYRGLGVGRVDQMHIPQDAPTVVEVVLALEPDTPLHEGVSATLDASGLTGLKTINLVGGDPRAPRLTVGSRIPAGESFMTRVTGRAEEIAKKLEVVVNQLAAWTSEGSRDQIARFVSSMDTLAQQSTRFLEATREPFANALTGLHGASKTVADLTGEVQSTLAMLREEAGQTLREVRHPLRDVDPETVADTVRVTREAMDKLDRRLSDAEAGQLIASLQGATKELTDVVQDLELTVRAGREDFVTTLRYLRQAAEDMREFSRIIAQNPSALLRGRETNP